MLVFPIRPIQGLSAWKAVNEYVINGLCKEGQASSFRARCRMRRLGWAYEI